MKGRLAGGIFLGGIIALSTVLFTNRSQEGSPGSDSISHRDSNPEPVTRNAHLEDTSPIHKTLLRFDEFLRSSLDSMASVGAAATVVHGNEPVYTLTFGVKRVGTADSVDRNTVFRLASVSKGFAGVLACLLHQKGKLDLDDRVIAYLPDFLLKDSASTCDMSIRHLMNHTSGLVPHAYDNLAEEGRTVGEILPRLVEVKISAPPGQLYGYQNVLFSMFDTIAELGLNKDYPELMSEYIFDPLDMQNASTGYLELVWNSNVAFPHIKRGGGFYPLPLHTGYYNLLPAAGINASIDDISKWLGALLGNAPRAIPPVVLKAISTPVVETPLKRAYTRRWDPIDGRFYSHGWRIFDYKGHRIMYHGGYVRGYRAEIAFCPELETGLAFLQNSPNGVASRCVPAFFNYYFEELRKPGLSESLNSDVREAQPFRSS
jgi:beta-lactamase class C